MPNAKITCFSDFYPDGFWTFLIRKSSLASKLGDFYPENASGLSKNVKFSPAVQQTAPVMSW
jgi:hypothetical protein